MKRRNGFTLIELLAVIVILAIIALIATPIVLGIIEDVKKDAFYKSVLMLINTTNMDITGKPYEEEYIYNVGNGEITNLDIPVSNIEEMTGSIIYNEEGKGEYAIHNDKYCVKKATYMKKAEVSTYDGICDLSTSENCFAFSNGTITDYYDYIDNNSKNDKCPRKVKIPEIINKKTVTKIGNDAFKDKNIVSVKFPSGITEIGKNAFEGNYLTGELDLSNTAIIKINDSAFLGKEDETTNQITSVLFPTTIKEIGGSAFRCNKIDGELDLSMYTNLTSIGGWTFSGNQITSVKFPNDISSIGMWAFQKNQLSGNLDLSSYTKLTAVTGFDHNQITSIVLPNSVKRIDGFAFRGNQISEELDLSMYTNLTSIEQWAFADNLITKISLPNDVEYLNGSIFYGNKLTGELDLSNYIKITTIGGNAFNNNQITSIKLPSSIEKIEFSAFESNKFSSEELDLSMYTNLKTIKGRAFFGNDFTSIKLPSSITTIEGMAFNNAWYKQILQSVTIYGRSDLTGITIEDNAFGWATGYNAENNIYFVNE